MDREKESASREIRPRRLGVVIRSDILGQSQTQHQRPDLNEVTHLNWVNHSAQRHIRQIAFDQDRKCLWLATWGGILRWDSESNSVTRYSSEHGLIGNATQTIKVDKFGVVWSAGQARGLATLSATEEFAWKPYSSLKTWTVLCIATCPDGGVYVAVRDPESHCALYYIATPQADLKSLPVDNLAVKDIDVLHVDDANNLWFGNDWGLHQYQGNSVVVKDQAQVRTLATASVGGLWIGTNLGLYHFQPGQKIVEIQKDSWPRDAIVSLSPDPMTGELWIITSRQVGRIIDDTWYPLDRIPPNRFTSLTVISSSETSKVWIGSAYGLYQVVGTRLETAFTFIPEDQMSNAVQALAIDEQSLWIGTVKGLYRYQFDDDIWTDYASTVPDSPQDIRTIEFVDSDKQVWIGSWRDGLNSFVSGYYLPEPAAPNEPVVALASSEDGILWAASIDTLYWRPSGNDVWEKVPAPPGGSPGCPPDTLNMGIIHTICPQKTATGWDIWVGTSNGLFCYPPGHLWIPASERNASPELGEVPIYALILDKHNRLWIGTSSGLFCQNQWKRYWKDKVNDVRTLALTPEGDLWIGTSSSLQLWQLPNTGNESAMEPIKYFNTVTSGLPANTITSLATRTVDNECEVWIGSMNGLSRYRHTTA